MWIVSPTYYVKLLCLKQKWIRNSYSSIHLHTTTPTFLSIYPAIERVKFPVSDDIITKVSLFHGATYFSADAHC